MNGVTPAQMEAALLHEKAEEANDLEATMATVAENPHYELPSLGLALESREAVREFYRRTLPPLNARNLSGETRVECVGPNTLLKERLVYLEVDGEKITSRVAVVIVFEGELLVSERMYADPHFTKFWIEDLGDDFADFPGVVPLK